MTICSSKNTRLVAAAFSAVILNFIATPAPCNEKPGGFLDPGHKAEHARLEQALEKLNRARAELEKERKETEDFAHKVLEEIRKAKAGETKKPEADKKALELKDRQIAELGKKVKELESEVAGCLDCKAKQEKHFRALEKELAEAVRKRDTALKDLRKSEMKAEKLSVGMKKLEESAKIVGSLSKEKAQMLEEMNGLRNVEKTLTGKLQKMEADLLAMKAAGARDAEKLIKLMEVEKSAAVEIRKLAESNEVLRKAEADQRATKEKHVKELEELRAGEANRRKQSKRWDEEKADLVANNRDLQKKLETYAARIKSTEEQSAKARGELVKEKIARQKLERQIELMQLPPIAPIYFGISHTEAQKQQARVLEEVKAVLQRFPELKVHVVGHTCNQGRDEANLALSTARAKTLADYLTANGIAAGKVTFEGKGESLPVNDNSTEALRKMNRRVEIWLSN